MGTTYNSQASQRAKVVETSPEGEKELRQLVDAVPQHIVVLSADGRRVHANQVVLDYHGLTLEEFLVEESPIKCFHPDDLEKYRGQRQSGMANKAPWEAEIRLRRKDGQYRWFLLRANPLRNEQGRVIRWYMSGTDIEDRKVAERELLRGAEIHAVFQKLVHSSMDGILAFDREGRYTVWNPALERIFGINESQRLGEKASDLCPFFRETGGKNCYSGALAGKGVVATNIPYTFADTGRQIFLDGHFSPLLDDGGNRIGGLAIIRDVTERKQAEREIQQLVDAVPHHIVVLAADGRRLYPNKVTLDYFGWTLEEFLDDNWVKQILHPNDLASFLENRQRGISSGAPFRMEARVLRKDGQYRWFLFLFEPHRSAQGEIVRWYATGTDVEDRKQVERELQNEKDRLNLLLELTNKLVSKLELRDLLGAIAASVRRVMQCDLVAVFLADSERGKLRPFVVDFPEGKGFIQGELHDSAGRRPIPMEGTLAGLVLRTGKAWRGTAYDLLQLGLENDPGFAEGLKTGCVLPVICCNRVLGVLALARRDESVFSQQDADFLVQVASQVAIAVDNALVIEDRKRAEDALRQSEAYLAEAQRLSHTGSWAHDPIQKEIRYWSPEVYRIFAFDPNKGPISYQEAHRRIHPEDLQRFDENLERAIREKTGSKIDFRLLFPDGSIKHVHCVSRPVFNASGEVVELVGTNMDVTEQYQARAALEKAFDEIKQLKEELYRENLALKEEIDQASLFEEIVGASEPLRRVLVQLAKVAPTDSTVLIAGETGTGKELIARAIHKRSQRSSRTFVSVNCAAIPQALIGSELFGHEKGAFTGATTRRLGRFELAEGGTLFLDEVGDLPAETQIALLRVLQERRLERIGGNHSISVSVRIIAATNRDLKAAIKAGTFRSDLFYRLNVFPIEVPPLRERREDIPLLVEYLTERYASKGGKKIKQIAKRTMKLFQTYDWPGNIRELQNVIERAVILCDGETLSIDEVWLQHEPPRTTEAAKGLTRLRADREKELIESALAESRGRVAGPSGAAARLGIPRSTLETKIRSLRINKHRFKSQ